MQVRAPALVADPAGDADVQIQIEVTEQRLLFAGEAMHHGGRQLITVIAQDLQQALAGIALVEEHRQLQLDRQRQVLFQDFFLLRARREITIEIQPAFTHRHDVRLLEQTAQTLGAVGVPVAGAVGVNTGGGEQPLSRFVQLPAQFQRLFAALDTGAGEHQLADPGSVGAVEYSLVFVGKTGVGQVDADIDELHGATSDQRPESISEL